MPFARRLRRLVDRDLKQSPYGGSPGFSLLPVLLPVGAFGMIERPYDGTEIVVLIAVTVPTALWLGFVGWRMWRSFRAMSLRGDRDYDRQTRRILSCEYRDR